MWAWEIKNVQTCSFFTYLRLCVEDRQKIKKGEFPYLIRETAIQHKCKAEEGTVRMVCNGSPYIICLWQQIKAGVRMGDPRRNALKGKIEID